MGGGGGVIVIHFPSHLHERDSPTTLKYFRKNFSYMVYSFCSSACVLTGFGVIKCLPSQFNTSINTVVCSFYPLFYTLFPAIKCKNSLVAQGFECSLKHNIFTFVTLRFKNPPLPPHTNKAQLTYNYTSASFQIQAQSKHHKGLYQAFFL